MQFFRRTMHRIRRIKKGKRHPDGRHPRKVWGTRREKRAYKKALLAKAKLPKGRSAVRSVNQVKDHIWWEAQKK